MKPLIEGSEKKGGRNDYPSTPKPDISPGAQNPKKDSEKKIGHFFKKMENISKYTMGFDNSLAEDCMVKSEKGEFVKLSDVKKFMKELK